MSIAPPHRRDRRRGSRHRGRRSRAEGIAHDSRIIARRGQGDATDLGSLRSDPHTVVADDGVPLHVELDDVAEQPRTGRRRRARRRTQPPTLVFVHGYALNLDCWHFQRAAYRGLSPHRLLRPALPWSLGTLHRQERHDRRARQRPAPSHRARGPRGPVVLVGHSMGGMSIMSLAEQHPYLFGTKVVGVGLISTTAGGLNPQRLFLPLLPNSVSGLVSLRVVAGLARGARTVDRLRRVGHGVAMVATDRYAFGDEVPASYVEFVDPMLVRHALRSGCGLLPELRRPRQVRASSSALAGCRPRSSAAPTTGSLRSAKRKLHEPSQAPPAGVRRRRTHGDHGAPRAGQRGARRAHRRGPGA